MKHRAELSPRQQLEAEVRADADMLTKPYQHEERINGKVRRQQHVSLFDQVRAEMTRATHGGDGNAAKKMVEAKPPVSVELLDLSVEMVTVPAGLASRLTGRTRDSPEGNIGLVMGQLGAIDDKQLGWVGKELEALRYRCERALSWQYEPFVMHAQCPRCKKRGILVMLDEYGPVSAVCTKCRMTWDRSQLGLLAMQI